MKKHGFKVGQRVTLNCKNFVPNTSLDDDGWFPVSGTVTGFTNKRIKAVNDVRETEGLYKFENVRKLKSK